ncbi:MAG TPA: hypothetical protein VD998_00230, partial [Verrucomicrobiae bacterium]|nr:hypothetical protein [Verrucomicrobiae bacterium]
KNLPSGFGFGIALTLAGLFIIGIQIFLWLESGTWTSMSLMDTLLYSYQNSATETPTWFLYPDSWIGLHKLLNAIPVSGLLFGLAWICFKSDSVF